MKSGSNSYDSCFDKIDKYLSELFDETCLYKEENGTQSS